MNEDGFFFIFSFIWENMSPVGECVFGWVGTYTL